MKSIDEPGLKSFKSESRSSSLLRPIISKKIRALLQSQLYGVLCSHGENQGYGSVLAYAVNGNLKKIFFSTPIHTRKFKLLSQYPGVAFVVDNRCQYQNDMSKVEAITATGQARMLRPGAERKIAERSLVHRHPQLKPFVSAPTCAIFELKIVRYLHVIRFQEVSQWLPKRAG